MNFNEGKSWVNTPADAKYTVVSYNAKLKTPYCNYSNLMALKAEFRQMTLVFYYQKGYGYIGATHNNILVSFVTPEL